MNKITAEDFGLPGQEDFSWELSKKYLELQKGDFGSISCEPNTVTIMVNDGFLYWDPIDEDWTFVKNDSNRDLGSFGW